MKNVKSAVIGVSLLLAACGISQPGDPADPDTHGVEEVGQPIAAPVNTPVWTSASGTLAITFDSAGGETLIVSSHPVSGFILVNDVATAATTKTIKKLTVTGSAHDDVLILDYANGTFAPGLAAATGVDVTFGAADTNDSFKVRGTGAADTITVGGTALAAKVAFNTDTYNDIAVTATTAVAYTFSLGIGKDVFNATSGAYGTGGAAFTGDVTVYGGPDDDTLTGGDGNDTLYGDLGNDTLNGGNKLTDGDVYFGGAGTDTVTYASRSGAIAVTIADSSNTTSADDGDVAGPETDDIKNDVEIVQGGSGDDTFTGEAGNQTFYGNGGNDTFVAGTYAASGAGDDTFFGGAGTDTIDYSARTGAITVTMDGAKGDDGESGEKDNVGADIESLLCPTAAVACNITGNTLDNVITAGGGVATVNGGVGDDKLIIGSSATAANVFNGGAGIDTVDFGTYGASINVKMDGTASTTNGIKIGTDVEDVICDPGNACTVTGNALNNHLWGSSAADTFSAGAGDDFIETLGGNDTIDCGDGSDIVISTGGTPVLTACEL